jgi:hypothetical protein
MKLLRVDAGAVHRRRARPRSTAGPHLHVAAVAARVLHLQVRRHRADTRAHHRHTRHARDLRAHVAPPATTTAPAIRDAAGVNDPDPLVVAA